MKYEEKNLDLTKPRVLNIYTNHPAGNRFMHKI